jgi:hypothetical protein
MRGEVMGNSTMTPSKRMASAVVGTLLGVAVVGAVGFSLHALSADPSGEIIATKSSDTIDVNGKTYPKASVELSVYPDNQTQIDLKAQPQLGKPNKHDDWPHYGPSTHVVLPAHSYITMTIKSYDGGEKLNNAYFAKVVGTVDGTMIVDGQQVREVASDGVQHTFTLHGLPTTSQDPLFVNIPLLKVEADEKTGDFLPTKDPGTNFKGHTITFSFLTGGKGHYVWNCEYPCGDGTYAKFGNVMSAYGYMSGKVNVV